MHRAMSEHRPVAAAIERKLRAVFQPLVLIVTDESHRHAGHAGVREGGESHFHVRIVSPAFQGLSRVERQRRVYAALSDEISGGVHALALTILTPDEAAG